MRKVPVVLVLAAVMLAVGFPSSLAARPRHASVSGQVKNHKPISRRQKAAAARSVKKNTRKKARRAASRHPKRGRPVIYQDASGRVAFQRFTAPVYGPFQPVEVQDYPQPPCEPIDAVVEARLHEPETDGDGGEGEAPEGPAAEVVAQVSPGGEPPNLAWIAQKLGSLFRPKSSEAVVKPQDVDLTELLSQAFTIPVEGVDAGKLQDSFLSARGRRHKARHLAIDIGAPRGTPVLATTDGEIVRITRERRGGKAIYQKDATGQYLLFYCHLSRYAEDLEAGQKVVKGEVIGYVGSTGHVIGGPHLHFSITRLPDDAGSFKRGLAINPYLLFLAGVP